MRILSLKPGHDGAIAMVDDGRLVFSLEAEKNGFPRHADLTPTALLQALEMAQERPDVLALSGWYKPGLPGHDRLGAGYDGLDAGTRRRGALLGEPVDVFTSSHERSHLFMVAGLAPGAPLDECAILLWEGGFGALYHWRAGGAEIERHQVLTSRAPVTPRCSAWRILTSPRARASPRTRTPES